MQKDILKLRIASFTTLWKALPFSYTLIALKGEHTVPDLISSFLLLIGISSLFYFRWVLGFILDKFLKYIKDVSV